MKANQPSCLMKYRGENRYRIITRDRAAYLIRAARSRRPKNLSRLGETLRRIEDTKTLLFLA